MTKYVFLVTEDGDTTAEMGSEDIEIVEIDLDSAFSYDDGERFIQAVLDSNLDGVAIMALISRVSKKFVERYA